MVRRFALPAFAALCGCLAFLAIEPRVVSSQNAAAPATSQFRIIVGLKDTEAKEWSGRVSVAGGEIAAVEGYRFSQGDRVRRDGEFQFKTKIGNLENQLLSDHPYGQTDWADPKMRRLIPQGIVLRLRGAEPARVRVETGPGAFEFSTDRVAYGTRLEALDGNAVVERLPAEEKLSEDGTADDYPAVTIAPDGTRWAVWLSYDQQADEVIASGGGKLYRLSGRGDHHAPAIAASGKAIHAVWSQNDNGAFHLYESVFSGGKWTKPQRLTSAGGSNLWPRLAADRAGDKIALVWQAFRDNQSVILSRIWDGKRWSSERRISEGPGNCWAPSAAFGAGKLWFAWDSYATGAYQVYAREAGGAVERITKGDLFSVRPSVAVMSSGVPVIAWEESDSQWGKDFAFLADRRGTTLYKDRRIRVTYRERGDWREVAASVADALPDGIRRFVQQPQLAADDAGRLYLAFRCRTSTGTSRIDYWAAQGRWETFLTAFDGDRWTPAVPMPSSVGRNSMREAIAVAEGRVHVLWPTDRRVWPGVKYGDLDVLATVLPAIAKPATFTGRPIATPPAGASIHPNETADTRCIREYRYSMAGKTYRIVRGDLHRHTELSNDGAGDGALDDLYRYALDAAQMDYAHVGDHQMGNDEEYNWWITQKSNDMYYVPQRFVPMYGYERSVWWPNGHRNVVWAVRGRPVLKIDEPERTGKANSGPILYPYLRETRGIATSHSSATEQGTDWRDNDPGLEPLVEIYQGFESSYEHAGAPRSWKEGEKTVHQGLRPLGFIWNAWAKGYKLGVQSSSDHVSTHTSYACILVEDFTRQGLLDAMRKRHAYAATDNIVVDYRVATEEGVLLMGDIGATKSQPRLIVKVLGTAPIRHIDLIKNNTYIHKVSPDSREVSFEYVDRAMEPGENYYYIRVEQADGQLAWSSPVWVKR